MSDYVTNEAVRIAAKAHYIASHPDWPGAALAWDDMGGSEPSVEHAELQIAMRAVLEAAADDIAAKVLKDAADRLDLEGLERNSELSRWDYDSSLDFHEELVAEWLTAQARARKD